MQVERELKFRINERAAALAWHLLPRAGRARHTKLDNVYYDTPDLRLHRAGAALRLRRAGRRWLQTLKAARGAQTALAERDEWEMPAPGGKLDCSLFPREAVRSATGLDIRRLARRLRPVFAVRFDRRSTELALGHGVRAEACIDRGSVEAGRRRETFLELELELLEGEIGPVIGLAESLVEPLGLRIEMASKAERGYRLADSAAPAAPVRWRSPPMGENPAASDAFAAICAMAHGQIGANADGVAIGHDPEYLHQLRVGVRRLRSALRAFRGLLRRSRAKGVERPWKKMMATLGTARDWDVFCEALADSGDAPALLALARRKRAAARREVRRLVAAAEFQQAQLRGLRWLYGDPWKSDATRAQPFIDFAGQALEKLHAEVLRRARRIDWRHAKRRHAVRIAVKRLRYGCDFFSACFPRQAVRPFLKRLASMQDTLGELNDIATARAQLAEFVPRAVSAAMRSERSRVRRQLAAAEREFMSSLGPSWAAFEAKRPFWRPKRAPRASG